MKRVNRLLLLTGIVLAMGTAFVVLTGVLRPSPPVSVAPIQLERGDTGQRNRDDREGDRDRALTGRDGRGSRGGGTDATAGGDDESAHEENDGDDSND
jgi:hypothetical protein